MFKILSKAFKTLKAPLIGFIVVISLSFSALAEFYIINGKEGGTKADALRTLILDPKAKVFKCDEQEATNKATLRKK